MPSCDMHRIQRLGTEEIEKREKESRDFRLEPKTGILYNTGSKNIIRIYLDIH